MIPMYMVIGIAAKITGITIEKTIPTVLISGVYFLWFKPSV